MVRFRLFLACAGICAVFGSANAAASTDELSVVVTFDLLRLKGLDLTPEAVSETLRTALAVELPGVTIMGYAAPSRPRPILSIEISKPAAPVSGNEAPLSGPRYSVSIVLADPAGKELFRIGETTRGKQDVLGLLRQSVREVAARLQVDDPVLPSLVSVPPPPATAVAQSAGNGEGQVVADATTAPTTIPAQSVERVDRVPPFWRRWLRIGEYVVGGVGAAFIVGGVAEGLAAQSAIAEFRDARSQIVAADAKERSEAHASAANSLFTVGGILAGIGGLAFTLDILGVYDRDPDDGRHAVGLVLTDGGAIGVLSVALP